VKWQKINCARTGTVAIRSLSKNKKGIIYMERLEILVTSITTALDKLKSQSLLNYVPDSLRNFMMYGLYMQLMIGIYLQAL
jgi:hypothetical protein